MVSKKEAETAKSINEKKELWKKAREGDSKALIELGILFGIGTEKDMEGLFDDEENETK